MNPLVVDLSHYQATVDFNALYAAGVRAVVLKATEGTSCVDAAFARRAALLPEAGLLRGAYHFGEDADGQAQADHFLATAKPTAGVLCVLDVERGPNGRSMTLAQAEAFVRALFVATGRYPVIYGGADYLGQLGVTSESLLARCGVWWAAYHPPEQGWPKVPPPWSRAMLWQYTDHGQVTGLALDCDLFCGDEALLLGWWGR